VKNTGLGRGRGGLIERKGGLIREGVLFERGAK